MKQKVQSLTGRITPELVYAAWRAVRGNRGAAGIDKVSARMFEKNLRPNLDRVMRELKDGTLRPKPARRVYIPKAPGKFRPLGIPAVRDRIAQEVLRRLLSPLFEERFHDDSYGFADGNILRLVEKFLRAGVLEDGVVHPTREGTPQGGVFSPLLANIALHVLDQFLEERGYRFVRYADDFVVLCRSQRQAEEALALIRPLLSDRLGLELSPEKTKVTQFRKGFAFLGFDITSWSVRMRAKSVENFKCKIRNLTPRSHNLDVAVIEKLNAIIRGTANYFAQEWSACGDAYRTLDRWIRMRLRCMKLKRKSCYDNRRLRLKHFRRIGLVSLHDFIPCPQG